VAVEREVDFFDPAPLGRSAEFGLSTGRTAAEQDAVGWSHAHDDSIQKFFTIPFGGAPIRDDGPKSRKANVDRASK
jgi:hypothetical protein